MLLNSPRVLGLNVERTLQPSVQLLEEIGLDGSALLEAISASPALLCIKRERYEETRDLMKQYEIPEEVWPHSSCLHEMKSTCFYIQHQDVIIILHMKWYCALASVACGMRDREDFVLAI